jgi:hypothetical protein
MDNKKILVIGDWEYKPIFESLLLPLKKSTSTSISIESICEISSLRNKPLNKENIKEYLMNTDIKYDVAVICTAWEDCMENVTDKNIFSGKVILYQLLIGNEKPKGADLYWEGLQYPSQVSPQMKELLEIK